MKKYVYLMILLIVSANAKALSPELLPLTEAPVNEPNRVDKIILGIQNIFNPNDPQDPVRRILVDWADGEGKLILSSIKDPELYKSVQKSIYAQLKEKNAAPKQLTQEQAVEFFDLAAAQCGLSLQKTSTPNIYDVVKRSLGETQLVLGQVGMEETPVAELYASRKDEDNPSAPRAFGYRMHQSVQPSVDDGFPINLFGYQIYKPAKKLTGERSVIVVWHNLQQASVRLKLFNGKFMHCTPSGKLKANWGDLKVQF